MQATALCLLDLAAQQFVNVVVPWVSTQMRFYKQLKVIWERRGKGPPPDMSVYETQSKLAEYDGVSAEYNELLIQVGYIVLFASAFPLAALACYANNLIEIRSDAFKLLVNTQRPKYKAAQGIGHWNHMLVLLGVVGVFTNAGIVANTSGEFERWLPFYFFGFEVDTYNKHLFLIFLEHLILVGIFFVNAMFSDHDDSMIIERSRQQFQTRSALNVLRGKTVAQQEQWEDTRIPLMYWGPVK